MSVVLDEISTNGSSDANANKATDEVLFDIPGALDEVAGAAALIIAGQSAGKRGGLKLNSTELSIVLGLLMAAKMEAQAAATGGGGGGGDPIRRPEDIPEKMWVKITDAGKDYANKPDVLREWLEKQGIPFKEIMDLRKEGLIAKEFVDASDRAVRLPTGKLLEGRHLILELPADLDLKQSMKLKDAINKLAEQFASSTEKRATLLFFKENGALTGILDDSRAGGKPLLALPEELLKNREFMQALGREMKEMLQSARQPDAFRGATR